MRRPSQQCLQKRQASAKSNAETKIPPGHVEWWQEREERIKVYIENASRSRPLFSAE